MTEKDNTIKLSKKAGGSSIDHKPLFSSSSGLLFIGCGPILRLFSTSTGEHIQDVEISAISLDKPEGGIIDICSHPFDTTKIILCFEEARIVVWSCETNTIVDNKILNVGGKRVVRMKTYVVSEEHEMFDIILAVKELDHNDLKLLIYSFNTAKLKNAIQKRFDFLMHSWAVTEPGGKDFLAGVSHNALTILNLKTGILNKDILIGNQRYFTCVVCHPSNECVAVGDSIGRIILYYDFLQPNNRSPHVVYHWHTLPVNDIIFSPSGSHLYSGGHEHVLVKWTVGSPEVRNFLPRLAAPIVHVTASSDMRFVAVSTLDNSILVVDSQQKIHCTLQQFTWGFVSVPGQKLFPSGLVIDSRSNCIVMNGKPGHIQFYSPQYSSLLYNMDVIGQNYISQERSKTINNAEVVAIQFSPDGRWLTTAQQREDPDFHSNTFLKFWLFESKSQTYKLDSCVTLQYRIEKIVCRPLREQDKEDCESYLFATQCSDHKFRLWLILNGQGQKFFWNCHSIGYYREYSLADICFSGDGSLLGAAFGPCLTMWDTDTDEMKCSLTKGSQSLRQLVFAHEDCSFMAITCTDTTIYAWNLLSLALMWSLDLHVSFLVANPRSDHVAAFIPDNSLYVFRASSADYVYRCEKLCDADSSILSAIFFPASTTAETQVSGHVPWLCNSSLYFFTSNQELMAFELQNKDVHTESLAYVSEKSAPTAFKTLVAHEIESAVSVDDSKSFLQLGVPSTHDISQFINSQPHAMAPVHFLCESLLQSLVIKR